MNTLPPTNFTEFKRGSKDTLPIIIGLIPFGLILGAQAGYKGMSVLETALMMGLNYAGGSEFAAVNLWTSPLPILLIWGMTFMINSRHILMGVALSPYLTQLPLRKLLLTLFLMTDETWALTITEIKRHQQPSTPFNFAYYMGSAISLYLVWLSCGLCGPMLAPFLGNLDNLGLAMAFPAVFLVLLRGMWRGKRTALPWLISLITAAACYKLLPNNGLYVILGTTTGLLCAYFQTQSKSD